MRFEPVIAMPSAWTSVIGQFVLHMFEGHLGLADMERMEELALKWLAKNPKQHVEMVVIMPSSARMSIEERQRMVRLIKQGEHARTAASTVILADGLLGSVQRSVLTGLMLLAPPPHPHKVFASAHASVRWLYPHVLELMPGVELDALQVAVDVHLAMFKTRTEKVAASFTG